MHAPNIQNINLIYETTKNFTISRYTICQGIGALMETKPKWLADPYVVQSNIYARIYNW